MSCRIHLSLKTDKVFYNITHAASALLDNEENTKWQYNRILRRSNVEKQIEGKRTYKSFPLVKKVVAMQQFFGNQNEII